MTPCLVDPLPCLYPFSIWHHSLTIYMKNIIKKPRKMENKILNGFKDLSTHEKLKKLEFNLIEINMLINSLENEKNSNKDSAVFARRFIDLKNLKKIESRINRFLRSPLRESKPGRPIEYPNSEKEKKRYNQYRQEGLSIRKIAKIEKMSTDTIFRKLKRYGIK